MTADGTLVLIEFAPGTSVYRERELISQLVFSRVRELRPEEQLSPARSHTMTLELPWVASIVVDGRAVWPAEASFTA